MSFPLALYQPLKAIQAPVLTAYAVVDEEETAGVILMFHRSQSRVVRTPERSLPRALEEVALRHIRTRVSHHFQQFIHRPVDGVGIPAGRRQIGRARSGESFVEMQRYAPVAAAGEQRIRQGALLILL